MTDFSDEAIAARKAVEPVVVPVSPAEQIVKAQVRLALAAFAGMLIGKHILPAGIVNDQLLDIAGALIFAGIASAWAFIRAKLNHSRWFAVAADPRVPDAAVKVAPPSA